MFQFSLFDPYRGVVVPQIGQFPIGQIPTVPFAGSFCPPMTPTTIGAITRDQLACSPLGMNPFVGNAACVLPQQFVPQAWNPYLQRTLVNPTHPFVPQQVVL